MDEYLRGKLQAAQDKSIFTHEGMSLTRPLFFWTHRTTHADICSIITSTTPGRSQQHPIKLRGERCKDGISGMSYTSPLESQPSLTLDEHERMNQALHDERRAFLSELARREQERRRREWNAAKIIQKRARGYFVRCHKNNLMVGIIKRHDVCMQTRTFLMQNTKWILTRQEHNDLLQSRQSTVVIMIQTQWRRYMAASHVQSMLEEILMTKLNAGATVIQKKVRGRMAKSAVRKEQKRVDEEKIHLGAGYIQRQFRGHKARVRVENLKTDRINNAVDCLQRSFRCCLARQRCNERRSEIELNISTVKAKIITKFFRIIKAKKRGLRFRNATMKFVRNAASVKIQCMARRRITKRRVEMKRKRFMIVYRVCLALQSQRIVRGFLARKLTERKRQIDVPLIFKKVMAGEEKEVIDLITFDEDNRYSPNDVDSNGSTVLSIAASKGLIDVVRKCLVWGTDPNIKNNKGKSAMTLAVERNHQIAAEYLLSKQSVEFAKTGRTLLHECAKEGMSRFALSMCGNGVDVNSVDEKTGRTPLMEACLFAMSESSGRVRVKSQSADVSAEKNGENNDAKDGATEEEKKEESTTAGTAAQPPTDPGTEANREQDADGTEGNADEDEAFDEDDEELFKNLTKHAKLVTALLRNGADPTIVDNDGNTAMHFAARVGNSYCVESILSDGRIKDYDEEEHADNVIKISEEKKEEPKDPFENAVAIGKGKESTKILNKASKVPWVVAVLEGNIDCANIIKDGDFDYNNGEQFEEVDCDKFVVNLTTPNLKDKITYRQKLNSIVMFDKISYSECMKELITLAGIKTDARSSLDGSTCAMNAAKASNKECFSACLEMGAGMQRQDKSGRTPVHFAAGAHDPYAAVHMLNCIVNGVGDGPAGNNHDVKECFSREDDMGRKPIHYAVLRGNLEAIQILQNNCPTCTVMSKDKFGNTALHYICGDFGSGPEYVKQLNDFGYKSSMEKFTLPPSETAIASTIRGIRKLGGSVTAENNSKKTPIMIACEVENLVVLKVILSDYKSDEELGGKMLVNAAHAAISKGKLKALQLITSHERFNNSHAHSAGPDGNTLLGCAIQQQNLEIIQFLIKNCGVNPTKQCSEDGLKESALHACARWGNLEVTQYICKSPKITPDLFNRKNKKGFTPVQYSAMRKNFEVTMCLVRGNANPYPCLELGWVSSWLMAIINTKSKKFNTGKPKVIVWKGRRFFMFGLVDEDIDNIVVPGVIVTRGNGGNKTGSRGKGGDRSRPNSVKGGRNNSPSRSRPNSKKGSRPNSRS